MAGKKMDIETRVTVSFALQRYLRAVEKLESASGEFNEACQKIRELLPRESRLVANIAHTYYLVTSDVNGGFNIEAVETV